MHYRPINVLQIKNCPLSVGKEISFWLGVCVGGGVRQNHPELCPRLPTRKLFIESPSYQQPFFWIKFLKGTFLDCILLCERCIVGY